MTGVLQERVALVTGGAQGLGQAICLRLAQEGCHVVVADVKLDQAEETVRQIGAASDRQAFAIRMDVTDESLVADGFASVMDRFGRLDVLVSNAGILIAEEVTESDAAKWKAVLMVNLYGYYLTARAAARIMKEQKSGAIIQINSKSGKKGSFKNSAYATSKFGGIGFTQSLALELAEFGVRVNAICPGNLLDGTLWQQSLFEQYSRTQGLTPEQVRQKYTDQVPMRRGCTYDDVCNVLVFLASDQSSYMTGQAINVTGGQEMR